MANPLVVPGLIAGGASLIGGILANRAQRSAAREQMAFQERMSNTSYQRAVSDMRMSGINPMLAYAQGGASSPGGAQPNQQDVIGPAVSSAMHARRLAADLALIKSHERQAEAQAQLAFAGSQREWSAKALNEGALAGLGYRVGRLGEIEQIGRAQYGLEARKRFADLALPEGRRDVMSFIRGVPEAAVGTARFIGSQVPAMKRRAGEMVEKARGVWQNLRRDPGFFIGPLPGER